MTFAKIDDNFMGHTKTKRARREGGSAAIDLWLAMRLYCGRELTDGFVPGDMLSEIDGPSKQSEVERAIVGLVKSGLVEEVEGGYRMHDYLDWADSRSTVLTRRQEDAARKRRGKPSGSRTESAGTPRGIRPESNRTPNDSHARPRERPRSETETETETETDGPPTPTVSGAEPEQRRPRDRFGETFRDGAPDQLEPTAAHLELAKQAGLDVREAWAACRDYYRGKGELSADWDSMFASWLRRDVQRARRVGKPLGPVDDRAERLAEDARRDAEYRRQLAEDKERVSQAAPPPPDVMALLKGKLRSVPGSATG
jgi:hypothetical protein